MQQKNDVKFKTPGRTWLLNKESIFNLLTKNYKL